jgi:hypothetical protein
MSGQERRDRKLSFDEIISACARKAQCPDPLDFADCEARVREEFATEGVSIGFIAYALDCRETGYVRGADQSRTVRASILLDDDYRIRPELNPERKIRRDGETYRLLDCKDAWRDADEFFAFRPATPAQKPTAERDDRIYQMRLAGASPRVVAKQFGVTSAEVNAAVDRR